MHALDALKQAASAASVPITTIGPHMGKTRQYVHSLIQKNSTPKADTLARMLDVCGYGLYVIPYKDAPKTALQITYDGQKEHGDK